MVSSFWCIPFVFFLAAVILNLIGCIQGTALAATVKPALMPLLSATTLAFLVGHIFYMCLFGGQSWRGLAVWQWAIALIVLGAALWFLVRFIGIEGPLLWPMVVYGFALMMLIFSALAGVLRMPDGRRGAWWLLSLGALLFAFSDSCIAIDFFGTKTIPLHHFVVMFTYLAAQTLLAVGGIRLILGK